MLIYLLLFLAYGIEPAVQYFLFNGIFEKKADKGKKDILMCWCICYALLCIKQGLSFEKMGFEAVLYFLIIAFYIYSSHRLFECTYTKIIIYVGFLLVFAMISDCLTFGIYKLIGIGISYLNMISLVGIIATYLSKFFYVILSYLLYRIKNKQFLNTIDEAIEVALFIVGIIAFEMPTIVLFNNMKMIDNNDSALLLFTVSQLMLLVIIVYFLYIVNRHSKIEKNYEIRLEKDAAKFESYEDINKLVEELRELRHDFRFHTSTLQQLYEEKRYDKLGMYINQLRDNVKSAERYIILDNKAVSGVLNQKVKEMEDRGIDFQHIIEISNFVLKDIDICSLLGNLLDNAIEASEKAVNKVVSLKIIYQDSGYEILCENTYLIAPVFRRGNYVTTKEDTQEHGFGIKIIRKIAENYHGMVRIETENERFIVNIFIPYDGEADYD